MSKEPVIGRIAFAPVSREVVEKRWPPKDTKVSLVEVEMCECEHPRSRHPMATATDSCLVPTCRCTMFRLKS